MERLGCYGNNIKVETLEEEDGGEAVRHQKNPWPQV
jgi:hypothetical protein